MHVFHKHLFMILAIQGEATWCYSHIERSLKVNICRMQHTCCTTTTAKTSLQQKIASSVLCGVATKHIQSIYKHLKFCFKHSDMHIRQNYCESKLITNKIQHTNISMCGIVGVVAVAVAVAVAITVEQCICATNKYQKCAKFNDQTIMKHLHLKIRPSINRYHNTSEKRIIQQKVTHAHNSISS